MATSKAAAACQNSFIIALCTECDRIGFENVVAGQLKAVRLSQDHSFEFSRSYSLSSKAVDASTS